VRSDEASLHRNSLARLHSVLDHRAGVGHGALERLQVLAKALAATHVAHTGIDTPPPRRLRMIFKQSRLVLVAVSCTSSNACIAVKRLMHVLTGDTAPVTRVAFSPTGTWLATASQDGDVRIWDRSSGQLMRVLPEGASVTSVAFTPNGQDVVSTDSAGRIQLQDACSLCGNASALLHLAATRVTRPLTPAERQAYGT